MPLTPRLKNVLKIRNENRICELCYEVIGIVPDGANQLCYIVFCCYL